MWICKISRYIGLTLCTSTFLIIWLPQWGSFFLKEKNTTTCLQLLLRLKSLYWNSCIITNLETTAPKQSTLECLTQSNPNDIWEVPEIDRQGISTDPYHPSQRVLERQQVSREVTSARSAAQQAGFKVGKGKDVQKPSNSSKVSSSKKPTKCHHHNSESDHSVERPGQTHLENTDLENRGSGTQTPSSPRSSLNSFNHLVIPGNKPIPFIETSFDRLPFPFLFSSDYLSTLDRTQFYLYFPSFIHPLNSLITMPKIATDLPPPGTKDALSFKGDNENHIKELPQWLENIEVVLKNHGINTDVDLKKYIERYAVICVICIQAWNLSICKVLASK